MTFESLPHIRRAILLRLKQEGPADMSKLAEGLKITKEAVRQQLVVLQKEGWIQRGVVRESRARSGRPAVRYSLTTAGDHLFPKAYDTLAVELMEILPLQLGPEALRRTLAAFTENRIKHWQPSLEGKSLGEKIKSLKDLYLARDPFTSVTETPDGFRLVENNCPFLNVASQQPALCSVTVSMLSRLLGVQVVREERFQSGDGRCVFHVYKNKPLHPRQKAFQWEAPAAASAS